MKSARLVDLVLVLLTIAWSSAMPTKDSTTRRPQIDDRIKQLTGQLMNASSDISLDTRTPPKVKQQMKKLPPKKEVALENSHPGIAMPVEDEDLVLEESTKKFNFYKIEKKPTTEQGISTWVLLNSQTASPASSTMKASRKPTVKHKEDNKNLTAIDAEIFNKITKPLFKKRPLPTTTRKPAATTVTTTTTLAEKDHKLTKIKASVLTSAMNNKNKTATMSINGTTPSTFKNEKTVGGDTTMQEISTINPNQKHPTTLSMNDNELIPLLEAKDDEIDLLATTTQSSKKTRRPTTKKKKNKKRRRPSLEKSDTNSTKVANKEKPLSAQIYNYLSREIIPTVGVGLVGLVVTAGLASYFLYPFGIARRSYEIDRKDKEGSYYYNNDEFSPGGVAEEEVIGKVIAGMPGNNNQYQNYRSQMTRDAYSNSRHKQVDFDFRKPQPQASVEAIYLTPSNKYGEEDVLKRRPKPEFYSPQRNYNQETIEHSHETGYTVDDKQFVVGNVPKEIQEVTPVVVPEHGPRNLPEAVTKPRPQESLDESSDNMPDIIYAEQGPRTLRVRKRRSNDLENEISTQNENANRRQTVSEKNKKKIKMGANKSTPSSEATNSTEIATNTSQSFIDFLRSYFEARIRDGLALLQVTTKAVSRYFTEVQRRFTNNMNRTINKNSKEQPRMH